jgi:hypothetical protein
MKRRDLDATSRILRDFISGHLMHLHLVHIYRYNQNMIANVAVRLNVILGQEYLFSPQIKPTIIIVWQNITYCSKKRPFLLSFNLPLQRYLQKKKQVEQFLREAAAYRREAPIGSR